MNTPFLITTVLIAIGLTFNWVRNILLKQTAELEDQQKSLQQRLSESIPTGPALQYTELDKYFNTNLYKEVCYNTVHEYFVRHASLAAFVGFTVHSKYKDRYKIDDAVWAQKMADLYTEWRHKGYILSTVMKGAPFAVELVAMDDENKRYVNVKTGQWLDKGESFLWRQELVDSIAGKRHRYTPEEIEELTYRRSYLMLVYPTSEHEKRMMEGHDDTRFQWAGEKYRIDYLNKLTGTELFIGEGGLPTVVYEHSSEVK